MVSHWLETSGIGLVLDTVQFTIRPGVGVSSANDLFSQFGSDLAIVALFLVLNSVTGGVVKPIASIAVVHVFIAQNRYRGGARLLLREASLESTSTAAGLSTVGLLRLLGLPLLGLLEATAELTTTLALTLTLGS